MIQYEKFNTFSTWNSHCIKKKKKKATKNLKKVCNPKTISPACVDYPLGCTTAFFFVFAGPWDLVIFGCPVTQLQQQRLNSIHTSCPGNTHTSYLIPWKWELCEWCRCTCARLGPCAPIIPIFDSCGDAGIVPAAALQTHTSSVSSSFTQVSEEEDEKAWFQDPVLLACSWMTQPTCNTAFRIRKHRVKSYTDRN